MTRIFPVPMMENAMKTRIAGFERLTVDPEFMNGQPCIRGMRITVKRVLEALSRCPDSNQLRTDYPELEPEDIRQALAFAAMGLNDTPDQIAAAPFTKVKEAAHRLIDQLPDDVNWDTLAYQIEVRASIERGLADADAGRLISQEDIEKKFHIQR